MSEVNLKKVKSSSLTKLVFESLEELKKCYQKILCGQSWD